MTTLPGPVSGAYEGKPYLGPPVTYNPHQPPVIPAGSSGHPYIGHPIPAPASSATGSPTPPLQQTMGGGILADYTSYQASAPAQYTPAAYADGTPDNTNPGAGIAAHLPQLAIVVGIALALSLGVHLWRKHHHHGGGHAD